MKKNLIYIAVAAFMFWMAGRQQDSLIQAREDYHLDAVTYLENAPPLMALTTVALGGFRGIMTDALWLRISHLQDKGDYFEIVQLADWVTKLEPRTTETWAFHAWNMAYNVSVVMSDYEDRWRWVSNGIGLLRDEGMVYNPGDPVLYYELGWLFLHKIGTNIDFAHSHYMKKWNEEMESLLGGARPDYENLGDETRKKMLEVYKLDPGIMQELEKKYGALDWRLPEPHALYWAHRGVMQADEGENVARCEHMISTSLARYKERAAASE